YIKFSDGTMVSYGIKTNVGTDVTRVIGSGYRSETIRINFPISFISKPSVSSEAYNDNKYSLTGMSGTIEPGYFNMQIFRFNANQDTDWDIHWFAIGRWK